MTERRDVFKAVKLNRSKGSFPIAPLQENGTIHTAPEDKASFLDQSPLQKAAGAEDIKPKQPLSSPDQLPFPPLPRLET